MSSPPHTAQPRFLFCLSVTSASVVVAAFLFFFPFPSSSRTLLFSLTFPAHCVTFSIFFPLPCILPRLQAPHTDGHTKAPRACSVLPVPRCFVDTVMPEEVTHTHRPQRPRRKRVSMSVHVDMPRVLSDRLPVAADGVRGVAVRGCERDRGRFINKHTLLNIHTHSQVAP